MADERAALLRLGEAAGDQSDVLARRVVEGQRLMAERFGAAAAPLTPGALGDLVVRDASGVRDVVVGGRVVVRDRVLPGLSGGFEGLRALAEREAARLWRRMRAL